MNFIFYIHYIALLLKTIKMGMLTLSRRRIESRAHTRVSTSLCTSSSDSIGSIQQTDSAPSSREVLCYSDEKSDQNSNQDDAVIVASSILVGQFSFQKSCPKLIAHPEDNEQICRDNTCNNEIESMSKCRPAANKTTIKNQLVDVKSYEKRRGKRNSLLSCIFSSRNRSSGGSVSTLESVTAPRDNAGNVQHSTIRIHSRSVQTTSAKVIDNADESEKGANNVSYHHNNHTITQHSSQFNHSSICSNAKFIQYHEPDVYGQIHPIETPELIEVSLIGFEDELRLLPTEQTLYAYEAEIKCPTLAQRDLKIAFIRTESFQVKAAATRYATYWGKRYTLFGVHRAYRPITMANMTPDEIDLLPHQLLNTIPNHLQHDDDDNNTTGNFEPRSLFYVDFGKFIKTTMAVEALVRVVWYIFHTLMEDVEIQRRGIIFIGNMSGFQLSQFPSQKFLNLLMLSLQDCVPIRMSAFHIVNPPVIVKYLFPLFTIFLKERLRKRFAIHPERDTKLVNLLLRKYTIPSHRLPTFIGGKHELNMERWINDRYRIEQ
jgi:CRAL/TRIO domain